MELTEISNLIGSLGFPIFVAVWMLYKSEKEQELHRDEVNKLAEALNELKTVITVLSDKLNR